MKQPMFVVIIYNEFINETLNLVNEYTNTYTPPGMRRRRDVSFSSDIGRDVADHAETSS